MYHLLLPVEVLIWGKLVWVVFEDGDKGPIRSYELEDLLVGIRDERVQHYLYLYLYLLTI